MKTNNNYSFRMDLSSMPTDILPIISKHLLFSDYKFKLNKIFRKNNDDNLLKFFFGDDKKLFKYINTYTGNNYHIECKDIDFNPLVECVNNTYNINVKTIRLNYHPNRFIFSKIFISMNDLKFYDDSNNKIKLNKDNNDSDEEEMNDEYFIEDEKRKIIDNKIKEMKIAKQTFCSYFDLINTSYKNHTLICDNNDEIMVLPYKKALPTPFYLIEHNVKECLNV